MLRNYELRNLLRVDFDLKKSGLINMNLETQNFKAN